MPELPQQPVEGGISLNGFPKPPIAPGAATEAAGRGADATEGMATELAVRLSEIRRTTQFNLAESEYRQQADDLSYKILRDPATRSDPDKARAAMSTQLQPIQEKLHETYPAADWDGMLTRNMRIWGDARTRVVGHAAIDNLERDTKDEIKARTPGAVADALTLSDPKDRQKAVTDHMQLIGLAEKAGLLTKGEADLERATFSYQVGKGQFDQEARANPGAILALDKPPQGVPPAWLDEAKNKAIEQLDRGQKMVEADAAAKRGQLAKAFQANPSLETGKAYMDAGGNQQVYEAYIGHRYVYSNPDLRDSFIQQIRDAPAEEAKHIVAAAALARTSANPISGEDFSAIMREATARTNKASDPVKIAQDAALRTLEHEFGVAKKESGPALLREPTVNMAYLRNELERNMAGAKTPEDVDKALEKTRATAKRILMDGTDGSLGEMMRSFGMPGAGATPAGLPPTPAATPAATPVTGRIPGGTTATVAVPPGSL